MFKAQDLERTPPEQPVEKYAASARAYLQAMLEIASARQNTALADEALDALVDEEYDAVQIGCMMSELAGDDPSLYEQLFSRSSELLETAGIARANYTEIEQRPGRVGRAVLWLARSFTQGGGFKSS